MDGGNVESDDSQSTEEKTYAEIFEESCPYYMTIGMTYDEYWYGEAQRPKFYREAYLMKNKAINQQMWINGMYMVNAIQVALDTSHKAKYPKEPFDIFPKTEVEKKAEIERERRKVIEYFTQLKQRWDNGNNRQLDT